MIYWITLITFFRLSYFSGTWLQIGSLYVFFCFQLYIGGGRDYYIASKLINKYFKVIIFLFNNGFPLHFPLLVSAGHILGWCWTGKEASPILLTNIVPLRFMTFMRRGGRAHIIMAAVEKSRAKLRLSQNQTRWTLSGKERDVIENSPNLRLTRKDVMTCQSDQPSRLWSLFFKPQSVGCWQFMASSLSRHFPSQKAAVLTNITPFLWEQLTPNDRLTWISISKSVFQESLNSGICVPKFICDTMLHYKS